MGIRRISNEHHSFSRTYPNYRPQIIHEILQGIGLNGDCVSKVRVCVLCVCNAYRDISVLSACLTPLTWTANWCFVYLIIAMSAGILTDGTVDTVHGVCGETIWHNLREIRDVNNERKVDLNVVYWILQTTVSSCCTYIQRTCALTVLCATFHAGKMQYIYRKHLALHHRFFL